MSFTQIFFAVMALETALLGLYYKDLLADWWKRRGAPKPPPRPERYERRRNPELRAIFEALKPWGDKALTPEQRRRLIEKARELNYSDAPVDVVPPVILKQHPRSKS